MSKENKVAVSINDIYKEFILPQSKNTTFKQTVVNIVKQNNKITQKVLDGVSFEVNKGDFFGIVGRNGSGKSTLLKLIAGVYAPTAGEVKLNGGLTPFIELGVGFNPELSGRDNVFLNGALLGYDRKQMAAMYDEIVEFAELGPFMEQKLKNYSSGMQVRLAFSIAIKAKNDILIFDEVLAVGDEAFQRKCLDVFEKYKAEGQTVILVTHDMETVREYCNRAILIKDGKLIEEGDPRKIAREYSKLNQATIDKESEKKSEEEEKKVSIKTKLSNSETGARISSIQPLHAITLDISWKADPRVKIVMVDLFKNSGEHISGFKSKTDGVIIVDNRVAVNLDLNLSPGKYHFTVATRAADDSDIEVLDNASEFTILKTADGLSWSGLVPIEHSWNRK